ncbi:MAG: hypothetical protein NZO58_04940 [Gemmataceae bacterium]|nr:hypothetical protein [Gemmataceae bacterium]
MFAHYPDYEEWFARVQLICFMLAMGVDLAVADFLLVARQPLSFLLGITAQILVLPLWAVAINHLFQLEPAIAVGTILVAAMPGGSLSKVLTYLGRGNAPLSIALTAVSTLAALVTVPVTLRWLATGHVPPEFTMPVGTIVADVALFLLTPLTIGMVLGRVAPGSRRAVARWSVRCGFVVVAAMIAGALGSGRIQPASHGWLVPMAIIVFCVAGGQLAMLPFWVFRLPRRDRLSVGMETTLRNINLALLLTASLFGGHHPGEHASASDLHAGVLFVVLFYAATAMGAGLPMALIHRRLARRERLIAPATA